MGAMRKWLLRLVFWICRNPFAARIARQALHFLFTDMSFAIPFHRLRETETLLAFHHPQPAYLVHILLVPRRAIADLTALNPVADAAFLSDLFVTVQSLVAEFQLEQSGYRLLVNGGKYQDFPYLHFHLISDPDS